MTGNLFKYSLRALARQKSYVVINLLGLAIGLACSIVIALFILNELSYDNYHTDKDRIYRVILNGKLGGQELKSTYTASPLGPTMASEFPEVEGFLRMNRWGGTTLRYGKKYFTEGHFVEADSSFFDFFSISLIRGNKKTALNENRSLVISETTAKKIFGHEDPMNKLLRVGNDTAYYRITGVMQDIPSNTHFEANMLGSFMTNPRSSDDHWLSNSFSTYVKLKPNTRPERVDEHFEPMIVKYIGPVVTRYFGITLEEFLSQGNKYTMFLQPLSQVHLDPSIQQAFKPANDPRYLWIFGSVAVLIIIIAAVNFMNLSTAQSAKRGKEVGIKKVAGSTKPMLVGQFLIETLILSFMALLLALIIVEITLPNFNNLLGMDLQLKLFSNWYTIPALLLLTLFIGILAGSYPAFYLSSFSPYKVLKGNLRSGRSQGRLRSTLVVLQFTISIILIVGTTIMFRQLYYMQDKETGFDMEQLMVISQAHLIGNGLDTFMEELKSIPGVMSVTISSAVPGRNNNNNGYRIKGRPEESFLLQTCWADYSFIETYGMEIVSGRYFDKKMSTDTGACILNESAVKNYMLTDPFATRFIVSENDQPEEVLMPVIGVVKDFHHESLRSPIAPYIFRFRDPDDTWGYISLRLAKNFQRSTVDQIESTWSSFASGSPMQSFFLDQDFQRMYREEQQNAKLSVVFTILGIIIAALGLYGLTSFTVVQRTKEIGVRKAFGATVGNIWYLIAKEIIILVLIASVIAVPLIVWVAGDWLQNYYYRISLSPLDFLYGIVLAVVIALLTISYRAIKTARANPTDSLRYE